MLTAFANGCAGKHWDCQVFNLHHLQPPGGTSVPCCAFSCLLFGCGIFSICGTICEEEGLQDWDPSKGLVPKALEHFIFAAPLSTISVCEDVLFFLLIDTSEQFCFCTLHIHMFGVCSTEKGPFYMPQEAETCLLCFAVCHAVARLGGVFLPRLCSSAGSTPLQLNRFGCIQIRSGCNRYSDDHTVTAHGRSRARQGSCGARDVDSGVADQLACSCRGSVGEVAQSYARKRSRPMFCGYRCAYFRLPSPSTSCSGPIPNLCYAFCFP